MREKIKCDEEKLEGLQRDSVVLNWYERRKIRQKLKTSGGRVFCIALPRGTVLQDGDILYIDKDIYVVVEAARELLIVAYPENIQEAATVAYELGNRHLPVCILKDRIKTPFNRHTETLLQRYSIKYELTTEPFEPFNTGTYHEHSHS